MSAASSIEWTERTWNPTTGCDKISPGCDTCYALTMARRLKGMGNAKYQRDGDPRTSGPGFALTVHPDAVNLPLRWRKPSTVFVNSMSDLFHHDVPERFVGDVWNTMALAEQHQFQILTKRPARARKILNGWADAGWYWRRTDMMWCGPLTGPLPNVWLGTSTEDQRHADVRIPHLLATPAAVRFISAEPLLGPLDLREHFGVPWNRAIQHSHENPRHTLGPYDFDAPFSRIDCGDCGFDAYPSPLTWVIVGGESGPGARPMDLDWVRDIRDQCAATGTSLFVKQLGTVWAKQNHATSRKAGDPLEWPEDLRIRQMPEAAR